MSQEQAQSNVDLGRQVTEFIENYVYGWALNDDNLKVKTALEALKDPQSPFSIEFTKQFDPRQRHLHRHKVTIDALIKKFNQLTVAMQGTSFEALFKTAAEVTEFIKNYVHSDTWDTENPKVKNALEALKDPESSFSIEFGSQGTDNYGLENYHGLEKLIKEGCSLYIPVRENAAADDRLRMPMIDKIYVDTNQRLSLLAAFSILNVDSANKSIESIEAVWDALLARPDIKEILEKSDKSQLRSIAESLSNKNLEKIAHSLRGNVQKAMEIADVKQEVEKPITVPASNATIDTNLPAATPAQQQQATTTDNGNMKALLDKLILPFKEATVKDKSYIAKINAINAKDSIGLDYLRDEVLAKIFKTPQIKQQINTATPEQLEQFANGVMRFFAEVKIDKNQPKGGTFIVNKGAKESGFIQSVTDLFTSLWAAIKSQSMDPLKNWYNNKPHAIIWDIGEFKAFASQATSGTLKNIPSEQAAQVKQNFEAIFAPPSKQTQQSM